MGWGEASSGAVLGRPGLLSVGGAPGGWSQAAPGGGLASLSPLSGVRTDGEEVGTAAPRGREPWQPLFAVTYPILSPSPDMRRVKSCVQGGREA